MSAYMRQPFHSSFFGDTITVGVDSPTVGTRGGVRHSYGTATIAAYVEMAPGASRGESGDARLGKKRWNVFTQADPGVTVDDTFTWGARTLKVVAPPSQQGSLYLTECESID